MRNFTKSTITAGLFAGSMLVSAVLWAHGDGMSDSSMTGKSSSGMMSGSSMMGNDSGNMMGMMQKMNQMMDNCNKMMESQAEAKDHSHESEQPTG